MIPDMVLGRLSNICDMNIPGRFSRPLTLKLYRLTGLHISDVMTCWDIMARRVS